MRAFEFSTRRRAMLRFLWLVLPIALVVLGLVLAVAGPRPGDGFGAIGYGLAAALFAALTVVTACLLASVPTGTTVTADGWISFETLHGPWRTQVEDIRLITYAWPVLGRRLIVMVDFHSRPRQMQFSAPAEEFYGFALMLFGWNRELKVRLADSSGMRRVMRPVSREEIEAELAKIGGERRRG